MLHITRTYFSASRKYARSTSQASSKFLRQDKKAKATEKGDKKGKTDEEELDPTKYFENRKAWLEKNPKIREEIDKKVRTYFDNSDVLEIGKTDEKVD